ncbi:MAG TPA: hypothetical protein VNI57_01265 [Candidatus Saccharimonadales bacterium]|nr:hypothetical protein [Candidatus Saccharimonadales bacterium]
MKPASALVLLLLLPGAALPAAADPVRYALTLPEPGGTRVVISIEPGDLKAPRSLVMPRAIPMGYAEQPYDRFVSNVRAASGTGAALQVSREDGPRWRISGDGTLRRIEYEVDLGDQEREITSGSDASKARSRYAGILGYSVFAYVEGEEDRPVELAVRAPEGWPAFSTLAPSAPPATGSLAAKADDFYALADSQVALGPDLHVLRVEGSPPLFVTTYAEGDLDPATLGRLGREALDALIAYFGDAPFPHYTIYFEVLKPFDADHSYGFSMEHLESATIFFGAGQGVTSASDEKTLDRHLYNLAHHIGHAWIPKRCYGEGYFPFSWELAPVLDTIWLSEGVGQYAAAAALAATRPDGAAWLDGLLEARFRSRLREAPESIRRLGTIQLSRIASTRYSEDFRTGSNSFARGGMMAAEMDEAIRKHTAGAKSLRDGLRAVCAWSHDHGRGFTIDEFRDILQESTGTDLAAIMTKWLAPQPAPEERR